MTTYTLTEAQRQQLLDVCLAGVSTANSLATNLLQSLTPNSGEPIGYAYGHQDFIGSVIGAKGEWAPNEVALFTHPAAPSTSLPAQDVNAELVRAADYFMSVPYFARGYSSWHGMDEDGARTAIAAAKAAPQASLRTSPELEAFQAVTGCATAGQFKAALSVAAWAAPSTSPWQPIETAPKDGTTVLLHPPSWANRTSSTGSWNSDKYARKPAPYWERDDCWNKVMLSRNSPTTHWMPLPAAPTKGGA